MKTKNTRTDALFHALDTRFPQVFLLCLGALLLGGTAYLSYQCAPDSLLARCSFPALLLYVIAGLTVVISGFYRRNHLFRREKLLEEMNTQVYDVFRHMIHLPYAIMDSAGNVKIVNRALQSILRLNSPICNTPLQTFFSSPSVADIIRTTGETPESRNGRLLDPVGNILSTAHAFNARIGSRNYELFSYGMRIRGDDYYFITFNDVTDFLTLREKAVREAPVVAYVVLDNLEELAQYVRVSYRQAANEIEAILRAWATEMNGFLREYDRDKFLLLFSADSLQACMEDNFSILNRIRQVKLGDNSFPVTVSMGIASTGSTLAEREAAASAALEMALQRGGDQVILRRPEGQTVFGGRVKVISGNTSIISRVNSNQLCSLVSSAGNVLIMAHRNPDFDAIGACVGLARLAHCAIHNPNNAEARPIDVHIVMNTACDDFRTASAYFDDRMLEGDLFVNPNNALDLVRSDTLLIITDVNNINITEVPDVVRHAPNIAIIDHHRQYEAFDFVPALSFIHPTASSASELVSEMLEQSPYGDKLTKEEATLLLSGIMLDTKNFTHSTGSQTFSVVNYLYRQGANTGVSRLFFNESLGELITASNFGSHTHVYRDRIAITWENADKLHADSNPRTAAAKAADKLLTVRGIEAAFSMIAYGNNVSISARSDDKINVQMIMEKIGGGGHFDMAGVQLEGYTLGKAANRLREAIDEYLDEETKNKI